MAGLPCRPPSVCIVSPQDLSYEKVEIDKIYIPANALIIAENEQIFLAMANVLKELKAVLIGDAGYVYTGKICSRLVFLLKCRGPGAVVQTIKTLKPKAGIFLGFGRSLVNRPHEIGDVIIAEECLRKDAKQGKLESYGCSECLVNVFDNGKYGWSPPKYRKQAVHVGNVLLMGDWAKNERTSAVALKTTKLDVSECIKGLGREWISIVGIMGTPRYYGDSSWEPYVAEVISSLVIQVLQDDQVFAFLGGKSRGPSRHSPLLSDPLQETMDCSVKIDGCNGYQFLDSDINQERIREQAEMYWAQVQEAFQNGFFRLSPQHNSQPEAALSLDHFRIMSSTKSPVENCDGKEVALQATKNSTETAVKPATQPSLKSSRRFSLPPILSDNMGRAEVPNRKISLQSPRRKISGGNTHSLFPTVSSSMAVSMRAALLPLGAAPQSQGSCYEIIRIRAEERTGVSRLQGGVLPPITRSKNK